MSEDPTQAKRSAEQHLKTVQQRWPIIRAVLLPIQQAGKHNHFADLVRESIIGKGPPR